MSKEKIHFVVKYWPNSKKKEKKFDDWDSARNFTKSMSGQYIRSKLFRVNETTGRWLDMTKSYSEEGRVMKIRDSGNSFYLINTLSCNMSSKRA